MWCLLLVVSSYYLSLSGSLGAIYPPSFFSSWNALSFLIARLLHSVNVMDGLKSFAFKLDLETEVFSPWMIIRSPGVTVLEGAIARDHGTCIGLTMASQIYGVQKQVLLILLLSRVRLASYSTNLVLSLRTASESHDLGVHHQGSK
ncbi:hypothetical protein CPB84DRAFT_1142459 [Gymnopilus junonius]|uniref:Uncharacterized protein n=1 Tax=Gymnopilus junonius TaxID=109634 RepID=A0A9P5NMQ1_GYMJU|nr:hypothetical protein CPB84DRAFT_1142459 [Gymnopilus junonius]